MLSRVMALLEEHPGKDHVLLVITTLGGESHELEIPGRGVKCGPELERELVRALPPSSFSLA